MAQLACHCHMSLLVVSAMCHAWCTGTVPSRCERYVSCMVHRHSTKSAAPTRQSACAYAGRVHPGPAPISVHAGGAFPAHKLSLCYHDNMIMRRS
jgi:hypothetical protein